MVDPWTEVINGRLVEGMIAIYQNVFTSLGAPADLFFGLIMLMLMTGLYLKTQDFAVVGIVGILIAGSVIPFIPAVSLGASFIFLALSIAIILFKFFKG